jgi:hypothetical protein
MRVFLHEGHDGEPGVEAWVPELIGFATWAPSRSAAIVQLPGKLADHLVWLRRHGAADVVDLARFEAFDDVHGNEILLPGDEIPVDRSDIDLAIRLLGHSRADLLAEIERAPEAVLDWDPPYRRFAPWASWRTVRANLAHIAAGETHYYLANIGHNSPSPPPAAGDDWRSALAASRSEALGFLADLRSSSDLARVAHVDDGFGEEHWSVRKVLRRMIRHEILHWKSIRRICAAYASR